MNRRNNRIKVLRNRCLFLWGIIAVFILLYKNYDYFYVSKVKNNKVMSSIESTGDKSYQSPYSEKDNEDSNKEDIYGNEDNGINNKSNFFKGNVSDGGRKYTYNVEKVKDILTNKLESDGKKIVFLTFDDGPSTSVTPRILDTLKTYDVKATFCLIGKNIEANERSKQLVKQIFEDGHAIGNHTYSHDMRKLYPENKLDVNYLMVEVEQTNTDIRNIAGQGFNTRILRLPGGYMSRVYYSDPNLNEFNEKLKERDMYSIDWNAYDFDSEGKRKNSGELLECLKESVGTQEKVVILMHDTYGKEETAKALPQIIEYLRTQGYEFKTIS